MFQSVEYLGGREKKGDVGNTEYWYRVVDTEFTWEGFQSQSVGIGTPLMLVRIYSDKGYSEAHIAKQLIAFFLFFGKRSGKTLEEVVEKCKKEFPNVWTRYEQEFQLLLTFT